MKDGIYFVVFRSNQRDFGNGTVVVKNNAVNGGDFGFTYQGKIDGSQLILRVSQHDLNVTSVVGMPQMQISISAKYIGDLI